MDNIAKEKTTNNIILTILLSPIIIFKYALIGLKAVTIDLFIKNKKINTSTPATEIIDIKNYEYEKIKGNNNKTIRHYKYSPKTLRKLKLEQDKLEKDLTEAGATRNNKPVLYLYKVRNKYGKIFTGTMSGYSKLDIKAYLLNEGYEVFLIKNSFWINTFYKETNILNSNKINDKDLIFLLTQLSTYIKSGITIGESIDIISKQFSKKNKAKGQILQAVNFELVLGETFSSALEKQNGVFPRLFINIIKAAEASGTLVESLDELTLYYKELNQTKKQMVSALTYPITILVFSMLVITFVLIFVVPQFTQIYTNSGSEMTGITLYVINFSSFITNNILYIISLIVLIIIVFSIMYKKNKKFRLSIQIFLMKIPVIKDIIIFNEITIFSKTLSSLLKNNVFITDSINILSNITNNEIYKSILYKATDNITKGNNISGAFKDHWAVPDVAYFMIVTGEETGKLAEMMQKISDFYNDSHKGIVDNLKSSVEPILISFLAIIVGLIIIAVIVPMYDVYNNIG